jgi:hypothetical protein
MDSINIPLLYRMPIAATLVVFIAILLAALEFGFRLGKRRQVSLKGVTSDTGGGGLVQNATLALLGLMIAFTYSFTVSHYETRKRDVIDEANALGTAFLRAGLVKERGGLELQMALLEYARTRVITPENSATIEADQALLERTLTAQSRIWPATERVMKAGPVSPMEVALMASVNDVIDMHTERVTTSFDTLPQVVFWTLLFIATVAVMIGGYAAGLSGFICRYRMFAFILALAATIHLIVDFDRSMRGFISISQKPMISTISDMEARLEKE